MTTTTHDLPENLSNEFSLRIDAARSIHVYTTPIGSLVFDAKAIRDNLIERLADV